MLPFIGFLSSCAVSVHDYKQRTPELDLSSFFHGQLEAYGIVQDYRGRVIRQFKADIVADWSDNKGILDEVFYFADGEVQRRCWQLTKDGKRYSGTAGDVIGTAYGEASGNALNWRYTLAIPVKGKVRHISLNDWMFLVDENNLINKASMSKFGLGVGEITLNIHKLSNDAQRELSPDCSLALINRTK